MVLLALPSDFASAAALRCASSRTKGTAARGRRVACRAVADDNTWTRGVGDLACFHDDLPLGNIDTRQACRRGAGSRCLALALPLAAARSSQSRPAVGSLLTPPRPSRYTSARRSIAWWTLRFAERLKSSIARAGAPRRPNRHSRCGSTIGRCSPATPRPPAAGSETPRPRCRHGRRRRRNGR